MAKLVGTKERHERDGYVFYTCSVCTAIVSYSDMKCPATGCGAKFDVDPRP